MSTDSLENPPLVDATPLSPGLEGICLSETRTSRVDGARGELVIAGYGVEELAPKVSFEEVVYLLWTGELPSLPELSVFRRELAQRRELGETTINLLRSAAQQGLEPMAALRLAAASLDLVDGEGVANTSSSPVRDSQALSLLARVPMIVGAYSRLSRGLEPVAVPSEVGQAAALLWAINGSAPSDAAVRALDTYWNTVVDHGANASTFTARVIVSTGSDLFSAVLGALGALAGPLHGGAPGPALDMVKEIGSVDQAEDFLRAKLDRGERLMGFGHRVYKVRDPRAAVLSDAAQALYAEQEGGRRQLFELACEVEAIATRLLDEAKPGRRLRANVEFYTALLLDGLGLGTELFTPLFAAARVGGWIAHANEQRREGRLIRPRLRYVGAVGQRVAD